MESGGGCIMSSLGRVFRRGKFYWIAYYIHEVERRESSRSPRELDAKRLLKKRLTEIRQGVFTGSQEERVILDELLETLEADYQLRGGRALGQFRAHLRPIRHAFGSYRAIDVTEARIDRYAWLMARSPPRSTKRPSCWVRRFDLR